MKSMVDELKKLAYQFGRSEPVFNVILDTNGDTKGFDLEVKNKFIPAIPSNEPVLEALAHAYREQFDRYSKVFVVDTEHMARATCDTIETTFLDFLENHQGIKNPQRSDLYVFVEDILLNRKFQDTEQTDLLLELYKYLMLNLGEIRQTNIESVHRRNVLSIFHLLKETHEARQKVNRR